MFHLSLVYKVVGLVLLLALQAGCNPDSMSKKYLKSQGFQFTQEEFFRGVKQNRATVTKVFLAAGMPVEERLQGRTVLHQAVLSQHPKVLEVLLLSKANPDIRWEDETSANHGFTALHLAAQVGCAECGSILLRFGANAALTTPQGLTAADLANQAGND